MSREKYQPNDLTLQLTDYLPGGWSPSGVVPDCVSEDTTLSTYDVAVTITYRGGNGEVIPDHCPDVYVLQVEQFQVGFRTTVWETRTTPDDSLLYLSTCIFRRPWARC